MGSREDDDYWNDKYAEASRHDHDYEGWIEKRHNRKDAPVPEVFGDVVEQMEQLQKSEAESFWE